MDPLPQPLARMKVDCRTHCAEKFMAHEFKAGDIVWVNSVRKRPIGQRVNISRTYREHSAIFRSSDGTFNLPADLVEFSPTLIYENEINPAPDARR